MNYIRETKEDHRKDLLLDSVRNPNLIGFIPPELASVVMIGPYQPPLNMTEIPPTWARLMIKHPLAYAFSFLR